MMRSTLLPEVTAAVKESGSFKNRKRRRDDAREHACHQLRNKEVLARTCFSIDELGTIDKKELIHCKNILQISNHHKKQRHSNAADKLISSMDKVKQPNATMKVTGAARVPLLLGKVQIGAITNAQCKLMIEESHLRGIVVGRKELITKMKSMLVQHEHHNSKCEARKKCFFPKLLTASNWSKDVVDVTLLKINEIRSKRK